MTLRDELIIRLQEEVIFLQTIKLKKEDELENYTYNLNGDLSESRGF